jgi:surface-anchored protein
MTGRTRLSLRSTVVTAVAGLAVLVPGAAPALADPAPADVNGADLVALSLDSGELRMDYRDRAAGAGAGADPGTLRFTAQDGPVGVPDDPAFAFLGEPGTPVWTLRDGDFPAFDTTGVPARDVIGGTTTLDLVSVTGPGSFAAYTVSPWGRPKLLLDSGAATSTRLPAGRRTGGVVWSFSAAGEYRVTLRATARTATKDLRDEATYVVTAAGSSTARAPGAAVLRTPAAPTTRSITPAPAAEAKTAARAAATAAAAAGQKVISDGHVDMGPQLSGGALRVRLKDDSTTPPTWRELADVVLKVTDKARIDVPAGAGYAFLGKAGTPVYLLPQSQQAGIVWPGWNTQHTSMVSGTRGNVTWRLREVSGPGAFKLFLTGSFGTPQVVFDSDKSLPQQLSIAPNTHAHGNWAFTKAGRYRLTVEMSATTTAGRKVSDTRTLTMAVGDSTATGTGNSDGGGSGTGTATGTADGKGTGGGGGDLARTGANVASVAGGGTLLLAAGTVAVLVSRRRRSEQDHVSTSDPS